MEDTEQSRTELLAEIQSLRDRLATSEETLRAIQQGEVDALIVSTAQGVRVFTLQSADQSYRLLVEAMQQGAATLSPDGLILYCNQSFANICKQPLEKLIGSQFQQFISHSDLLRVQTLMKQAEQGERLAIELLLTIREAILPVYLSITYLNLGESSIYCVVATDLTEQKHHEETLAAERLARLILEQAGEAILVCDQTGHIIRASEVASQLWNETLLAQPFDSLTPLHWTSSHVPLPTHDAKISTGLEPNSSFQASFTIASVLQGQTYEGLEVELARADGQVFNLVLNARPLTDWGNHFRGAVVSLTDITRRKQAEVALQSSQVQLQHQLAEIEAIYQSAPIGLNVMDANLRFVRINQRLADMNGLSVEAHLGHTLRELLPEMADAAEQLLQPILETGQPLLHVEISAETPAQPGVQRTWIESFLPLKEGDRVIGISTVCEEITERKHAEAALKRAKDELELRVAERTLELQQANDRLQQELFQRARIEQRLRQSEQRFQAFMNYNPACAWITDAEGQIVYANRGYPQTFQLLNSDIEGHNIFDLYPPDIAAQFLENIQAVVSNQQTIETIEIAPRIDGTIGEFLVYKFPLPDPSGQLLVGGIAVDMTERKRVENALQASETRYRGIVEDQTELICRFLPDTTILFVNEAFCRYYGLALNDVIGKSYQPVIFEDDRVWVAQQIQSMSRKHPTVLIEHRVVAKGEVRWMQWSNRMLFDAQGQFVEYQAVGRDITELKQAEQALRESKERLQLAVEASGDGIWDWNISANKIYFSPQYFQMLGYEMDELPHTPDTWYQLVHPDDMVWVQERLHAHLNDKTVRYEFDYRLRTKSGEWKWIADYGKVVVWDDQGKPLRMIGTHRDVNDRKLMETALRFSEEQRRLAIDLTNLGFWDLHVPSGDLTWNDNIYHLMGVQPDVNQSKREIWRRCLHPDDFERVEQRFAYSLTAHIDYEAEYRVVHPDGSLRWLLARGRAIYDEQNQPLRSLGVILDINDRKLIEASLQESNRRWRSLLDNVQLVVIELDINGDVEYVNPFFLNLTGYHLAEVVGQYWFGGFLTPDQQPRVEGAFREVLEHNFHTHYQNPIVTKAGEERMIAWSNTILRDATGQTIGTISIGEDITERYKVERMKAEFIAVVSHELRTPLTSMQAALSLLNEKIIDPTSPEGEATIQIATDGTDRLVRLVSDILDLERLESGKVRLDKHPCQVEHLIETAVAQMQELAKQADITLEANPCAFQIEADGDRLLQVLTNLLSNAIKFSPNRSVIQVTVEQQNGNRGVGEWGDGRMDACVETPPSSLGLSLPRPLTPWLLFTVRDRGRGIPVDSLESIFGRFHQVDASDSREKGGTGLGLAICRSIVRQHGGEIWAESTLGEGSTFYFTIPMAPTEKGAL